MFVYDEDLFVLMKNHERSSNISAVGAFITNTVQTIHAFMENNLLYQIIKEVTIYRPLALFINKEI